MTVGEMVRGGVQRVALAGMMGVERLQTGVSFLPMGDRYYDDPYGAYRTLREKDPIHRSRLINGWVLTRHADVTAVLRDGRFSADERKQSNFDKMQAQAVRQGLIDADEPYGGSMLRVDPPDHTRLRSLVSRAFTPRTIEGLRGRIESIVAQHIEAVVDQPGMDVIAALAYPLPVIVIAELLGIPVEDQARFKHWSDEMVLGMGVSSMDDARRSRRAQRELRAYFEGVASARRANPREDLLSALLAIEDDGGRLSADELYETCALLLVAGHETTTNLIGNGLLALLRHPDEFALLRREPELIDGAVEEMLRYDSPVQATTRMVTERCEFGGKTFLPGQQVALLLGAANRDPAQFDDPDRLDVRRENARHAAFGHGIHYCLGAPLARLEAPIAFRALIERFPHMRLDETVQPRWKPNLILRGLSQLSVVF